MTAMTIPIGTNLLTHFFTAAHLTLYCITTFYLSLSYDVEQLLIGIVNAKLKGGHGMACSGIVCNFADLMATPLLA